MKVQIQSNNQRRDLGEIAVAVGEAVAQSFLLGADGFSGAVSSLFRALEAMRGSDTAEAVAATLVEDTAAYAIARFVSGQKNRDFSKPEIVEFTRQAINKIRENCQQRDLYISDRDIEYPSSNVLFDHLAKDSVYHFRDIRIKTSSPHQISEFREALSEGLGRISAKRPEYFAPLWAALFGPAATASDYSESWKEYRSQLIAQFEDQPVFGEEMTGVKIAQVYVPLRCWWGDGVVSIAESPTRTNEMDSRRYDNVTVSDLEDTVNIWLSKYDMKDRIRFISGGPGSGKSTFAKKLSSTLSTLTRWRVLFVPLQRLSGSDHLENRINQFFMREISGPFSGSAPALSGLGFDSHKDWLFVFDGLDELAKEGGGSESAAQDFASTLQDFISRVPSKVQARFIVLGRAPSMQEARKRLNLGAGKTLYVADLLPFSSDRYSYTLSGCTICGDPKVVAADQRADLWLRWALSKGKDTRPPPAMSAVELADITKEPLLAHLLIISGYVEENWDLAAENRNRIYEAIFQKIWNRESSKESRQDLNDLGEAVFTFLLQALGVAAWRGGGRTGDEFAFLQVRDTLLPPGVLKQLASNKNTNLANVALLFYTRKDEEGGQGYEFVHKSFGEYLTACAILDAFIRWGDQVADNRSDFDEEEFLTRWVELTGSAAITDEVFGFLNNQIRLRLQSDGAKPIDDSRRYVKVLRPLISRVITNGFPIRERSVDYRVIEVRQNNAELILWCVLDGFARIAYPTDLCRKTGEFGWQPGPIDITPLYEDPNAFSRLFARQSDVFGGHLGAISRADEPEVVWLGPPALSRSMSRLYLPSIQVPGRFADGFDFEGCDLSNATFFSSRMFGWNFRCTNLTDANFAHCELRFVSFEQSCVDGVNFSDTIFDDTVDFSPISKKGIKTDRIKKRRYKYKNGIRFGHG